MTRVMIWWIDLGFFMLFFLIDFFLISSFNIVLVMTHLVGKPVCNEYRE
jgi:hypothetical protein